MREIRLKRDNIGVDSANSYAATVEVTTTYHCHAKVVSLLHLL